MAQEMTPLERARLAKRGGRRADSIEFKLIYAVGYIVFLGAAIAQRGLHLVGLTHRASGDRKSVFGEARDAAGATIPYAFMG